MFGFRAIFKEVLVYLIIRHYCTVFWILESTIRKKKEKRRKLKISCLIHYEINGRKLNVQIVLKLIYFQIVYFFLM